MKLNKFLVKAKIEGYATGEATKFENGARVLSYKEEGYEYQDTYFGFNPFIGEEVVWQNGKVIWAMNYYGKINTEKVSAKDVYNFLKKAMALVKEDRPFRGPNELKEDDWYYTDGSTGDVNYFKGKEKIYYQDELVYELDYHGGIVKEK